MHETLVIDLSAKLEQWNQNTVVAITNKTSNTVLFTAKVKKQARDWLKNYYPYRSQTFYLYLLFSALIYVAIRRHLSYEVSLVIDADYPGVESKSLITNFLVNFIRRDKIDFRGRSIKFLEVKGSKADRLAREVFIGNQRADQQLKFTDVQKTIDQ